MQTPNDLPPDYSKIYRRYGYDQDPWNHYDLVATSPPGCLVPAPDYEPELEAIARNNKPSRKSKAPILQAFPPKPRQLWRGMRERTRKLAIHLGPGWRDLEHSTTLLTERWSQAEGYSSDPGDGLENANNNDPLNASMSERRLLMVRDELPYTSEVEASSAVEDLGEVEDPREENYWSEMMEALREAIDSDEKPPPGTLTSNKNLLIGVTINGRSRMPEDGPSVPVETILPDEPTPPSETEAPKETRFPPSVMLLPFPLGKKGKTGIASPQWGNSRRFKVMELRDMIEQRTRIRPGQKVLRRTLVGQLKALDRGQKSFRLLDLPAEVRNMIFQRVLTHNDEKRLQKYSYGVALGDTTAYPALLGVNRQISNEASGYLYNGVVSYTRDYYGVITPHRRARGIRNLTVFLAHWCENENGQVADLVKWHLPLEVLKIVLNQHCTEYRDACTKAIQLLLTPLIGHLLRTEVQLMNFGAVLKKAARATLAELPVDAIGSAAVKELDGANEDTLVEEATAADQCGTGNISLENLSHLHRCCSAGSSADESSSEESNFSDAVRDSDESSIEEEMELHMNKFSFKYQLPGEEGRYSESSGNDVDNYHRHKRYSSSDQGVSGDWPDAQASYVIEVSHPSGWEANLLHISDHHDTGFANAATAVFEDVVNQENEVEHEYTSAEKPYIKERSTSKRCRFVEKQINMRAKPEVDRSTAIEEQLSSKEMTSAEEEDAGKKMGGINRWAVELRQSDIVKEPAIAERRFEHGNLRIESALLRLSMLW